MNLIARQRYTRQSNTFHFSFGVCVWDLSNKFENVRFGFSGSFRLRIILQSCRMLNNLEIQRRLNSPHVYKADVLFRAAYEMMRGSSNNKRTIHWTDCILCIKCCSVCGVYSELMFLCYLN